MKDINKDFRDFMTEEVDPPSVLAENIMLRVKQDLSPDPLKVFAKVCLIHFLVACFTLSICPQFGLRLFGEGPGIMGWFMNLRPSVCAVACGSFFIGTSVFVAGLSLRPEELRVLQREKWLAVSALVLLSLGFFIMADTNIAFVFAAFWAFGSLFSGISLVEALFFARFKLSKLADM